MKKQVISRYNRTKTHSMVGHHIFENTPSTTCWRSAIIRVPVPRSDYAQWLNRNWLLTCSYELLECSHWNHPTVVALCTLEHIRNNRIILLTQCNVHIPLTGSLVLIVNDTSSRRWLAPTSAISTLRTRTWIIHDQTQHTISLWRVFPDGMLAYYTCIIPKITFTSVDFSPTAEARQPSAQHTINTAHVTA